jgi:hypothetical protein
VGDEAADAGALAAGNAEDRRISGSVARPVAAGADGRYRGPF